MAAISLAAGDFEVPVDIANAACDHLGSAQITTFQDDTKIAKRLSFRYDKRRRYELERNLWVFSIRKAVIRPLDATSMTATYGAWDATKVYVLGSIVSDPTTGKYFQALGPVAANNQPALNPSLWQEYFGPQVADVWASSTTYWAGDVVLYPGNGPSSVYLSLQNNNAQQPNVIAAWDATVLYSKGQTVTGSDTNVYQSLNDLNFAVDPTTDGGVHWALASTLTAAQPDSPQGQGWLKLGAATLSAIRILYPIGYGPSSDTHTKNVFPLPYGYLRKAPQDPKAGQLTWLGGPANNVANDWELENGYLLSDTVAPMLLRFGADVTAVSAMDPMFCELFAAGLALDVIEPATQAADKKQAVGQAYAYWGKEARTHNAIEVGPVTADEDEYISVRR